MVVVDMLRLALAAQRAQAALGFDHRVVVRACDPVSTPEVVLAR
jgi:hypothetical protein